MTKEKSKSKKSAAAKDAQIKNKKKAKEAKVEQTVENASSAQDTAREDQMLRLQADFDNFRKRTLREKAEWYQRANEELIMELLPVLDHFEMGLQTAAEHKSDQAVTSGFKLVHEQLQSVLRKFGVVPIDAEGQKFDPHQHEAMTHLPSDEYEEDKIIVQTRRGYMLGERLLRPAQVVVSSGAAGAQVDTEDVAQQDQKLEGEA